MKINRIKNFHRKLNYFIVWPAEKIKNKQFKNRIKNKVFNLF